MDGFQSLCAVIGRRQLSALFSLSGHVILSDDGLQNTGMWRDFSVCVFNKEQGIGNGLEIPFGPLREPISAVHQMDAIVVRGTNYPKEMLIEMGIETKTPSFGSVAQMAYVYRSDKPEIHRSLDHLKDHGNFDAVAGIASPRRFFEGLQQAGLMIKEHTFPDHYVFYSADTAELSQVFTTEKDAVELHLLEEPFWIVVLESLQPEFETWLIDSLKDWSIEKSLPQLKDLLVCPLCKQLRFAKMTKDWCRLMVWRFLFETIFRSCSPTRPDPD